MRKPILLEWLQAVSNWQWRLIKTHLEIKPQEEAHVCGFFINSTNWSLSPQPDIRAEKATRWIWPCQSGHPRASKSKTSWRRDKHLQGSLSEFLIHWIHQHNKMDLWSHYVLICLQQQESGTSWLWIQLCLPKRYTDIYHPNHQVPQKVSLSIYWQVFKSYSR